MWPWPAKMAQSLFTVHSHNFHVWELASTPAASQVARAALTSSIIWRQHQQWQHHLLRLCSTSSLACSMSEFSAQLSWSGFSFNFLHTSDTTSNQHVPPNCTGWSTGSPVVTYLTVICAFHVVGEPTKCLLSLEHPKRWFDLINWLIDWFLLIVFNMNLYICERTLLLVAGFPLY